MTDYWKKFGLSANPYESKPLTLSEDDLKLFIGREKELEQLNIQTGSDQGGIVIVEGDFGVGKTSFVNMYQHQKLENEKYLPSYETIELFENTDLISFMLYAFSNMLYNLENLDETKAAKKSKIHNESKSLIEDTRVKSFGGNLMVLGTGGGGNYGATVSKASVLVLPALTTKIDKWIEFVLTKFDIKSIILPMDNFDKIDDDSIKNFLNSARDTLIKRKNVWWIIIGQKGLFSMLEKKLHKFSEIVTGKPVILEPLTLKEIHEMIERRYEILKTGKKVEQIIPKKIVDILYETSGGESRYILKRLSDMTLSFMQGLPTLTKIPVKIAKKMLQEEAKRRIENENLTSRQLQILKKMASKDEFQPKDHKKFGLKDRQGLMDYIKKFTEPSLVTRVKKENKTATYRATGDVILYFTKTL